MKKTIYIIIVAHIFTATFAYGQSAQRMKVLYHEGKKLYDQWDLRGAAKKWEPALEIAKRIGYEKEEIGLLNDLGNVYKNLGDYPKAISYYEQALKISRKTGYKKGIGYPLVNLGIVYKNLGDYPTAISYYRQALEICREIGDKKGIGANFSNLGVVHWNLGDYQKAISYYKQALEIKRKIGGKNKKGIGNNLNDLGVVYTTLGDYPTAISYYEQALEIHREIGGKKGIGAILNNLGAVYYILGDYVKSITYYEQSLEIRRKIVDKKGIGDNLSNLGLVYKNLGDYAKAITYYDKALEIEEEIGDKKEIGADLSNLGIVSMDLGDYSRAISYYEQALKIYGKIGVPTGTVEANMADVWLKMGEIEKAEETYLRLGWSRRLGRLNLVKRNYKNSIEYFDKSLKRDLQSRDAAFLFADYVGLGKAYEGMKAYGKARENYDKALAMVEEQREVLGEGEKSNFFMAEVMGFKRIEPYEGMVRVLIDMDTPAYALFYSENLKARVLSEAIARGQSMLEHGLPVELSKEEDSYITQIRGLRKQMEVLYKNKAMDTYYEKEKELKTVKAKQQQFITRLREQYPEYTSINYPQPIHANELILNANELLIEFEVTETTTHVFFLKDGELKTRTIYVTRDSLDKLVLDYRGFFEGITKTTQLGKYDPKGGKQLFDLLFGDALTSITEGTSLIIVPDEFLSILPFEVLVVDMPIEEKYGDSEFGPFPLGVTYLADKYLISYAQSATSLTLLRTLKKGVGAGNNMLVVADPIFSANDSRLRALAQAKMSNDKLNLMNALVDWKQMGVNGVRSKDEQRDVPVDADAIFPRLEKTTVLAQAMQSLFSDKAVLFSGNEAKEDKIRATDFSQYRYLTFATHGILDRTVPYIKEPALVLTQVGNLKGYDGFLTMTEVMGLKLDADVVALTACETGVGKNVSGEGVMGMGRAFQYAGAQNVLVSLWSVAETSATQLTLAFFKYLKEGKEPKHAIRLARNDIRRQGYEHPFYWASFILFGK